MHTLNELQATIALRFIQKMKDLRAMLLKSDKDYTEAVAKNIRLQRQINRLQRRLEARHG